MPSLTTHNTPALRFPGYTGVWEQHKFSDLVMIERGGSPRPISAFITKDDDGLNWVKIGDAPEQGNYITHTAEKIKPEGLSKTREVHPGDLILSNSMSFGKPYIMAINGCIHDGWLLIRDTQHNFDLTFLCVLLGTDNMLSQYRAMAAGSTVNNLNKELVGNTTVYYLPKAEQKKIGALFSKLDGLINLHQRQTQKLTELKQGLLHEMFPREGESVPRLRFPGFTTTWKQQKLGDIGKTYTGLSGKSKTDFGHGKAHFVTYMNVYSHPVADINQVDSCEIDSKQHEVQYGDVFFTTSSETPDEVGMSSVWLGNIENTYLNSFCFGYRPDQQMDPYFMAYILRSPTLRDQFILLAQGISRYNISKNKAMDIKLSLPSLSEQQKIGSFFHHFDDLINLHERYVMILIHLKKGLLQKMFPQD